MLRSRLVSLRYHACLTHFYSQTEQVFLTPRSYLSEFGDPHELGNRGGAIVASISFRQRSRQLRQEPADY
jgi:hypothetical protein